ncbi:MAG: hypothetical protein LBR54_02440 [Oscillospiraceae bacterium]|jgi:hypothetical protein|nr:hypothetical protein [Oscillospiraceae bacterium]
MEKDKKINFEAMYYTQVGKTQASVKVLRTTARIFKNTNQILGSIAEALKSTAKTNGENAEALKFTAKTNGENANTVLKLAQAFENCIHSIEKTNEELLKLSEDLSDMPEDEESETVYVTE